MKHYEDKTPLDNTASCRNLAWLFELCQEHSIDPRSILRNLPCDRTYLEDPSNFIDWDSFALLHHNIAQYLTTEELVEAARLSRDSKGFRVYRVLGALLYKLSDQFLATFNSHGYFARLYPCQFSVLTRNKGTFEIELTMNAGCAPSIPFQSILAGQITGLAEKMGYRRPRVSLEHTLTGAIYTVTLNSRFGIHAFLKRVFTRPQTVRDAAIELSLTHHNLLDKYVEAQKRDAELQQVKEEFRALADKYALISGSGSEVVWTAEPDKGFTFVSPAISRLLGYSVSELLEKGPNQILSAEFSEQINQLLPNQSRDLNQSTTGAIRRAQPWSNLNRESPGENTFETELLHRNGRTVWTRTSLEFIPTEHADGVEILGVTSDISNEKIFKQKLSTSEANYEAITNNADDGIIIVNEKNYITFANPATSRIFGYSNDELVGLALGDLFPEFHSENVQFDETSLNGVMKDGTAILLEMSFTDQHRKGQDLTTCIIRDVTTRNRITAEREALHEQLLAAQKMESIGQLTGGIAHDFNNLLVAINGFAELSQLATTSPEERDNFLNQIRRAGNRAAEMTQKLLAFSRRQIIELRVIDLNTLISDLNLMIRRLLPENIEVQIHRSLEEVHVFADSGQLEQVIVNLAVNARDAMTDRGKLEISVRNQKIDEAFASNHPTARPGDFVLITVQDTGPGIPDETMEKIFEPFFTTKPEGVGTGLGLSVVYGIVSQHNGFIDVTSNSTEGTCFRVFLPATESSPDQEYIKPSMVVSGGTETLMLVEDNEHVRDLARLILKGAGYSVIEAVDGADAINQFREIHKEIDLVILDVVMPKMGGREVMAYMQEIDPQVKILFTSGYANQGIHTHFILEEGLDFIQKPYSTDALRAKIRQSLARKSTVRNSG